MSLKDINVATIVQQTRVIAASADAQPDDVLAELVTNLRHCQREGFNACLHAGLHIAIMELVLAIPLKKVSFAESIIGTVLFCAERVDPRQNSLVADNIHYGLVRCIERYLNVSSVIIQSCLYIAMAMLHEGNCRDFVDSGIIDVVMTYLKSKFQGEEEQLILISGLLTELAHENDVVVDRLVASGYMEILVKIWSASEESSSATVSICRALVQLANNREHRAQMLRLYVLNSCFNAFNIFQRDEEVIATVLRVIEKLTTQYTQACDNFVITGGLTSLSQIFHTAYVNTHPRLRRTLCSLIGNIVSQSRESSVADIKQRVCLSLCELIPTLIVGNATKDARVVNTVMEALTRCATDESIIRKFVAAKVIELASNSLRYNLRSDRCVVSTFLLLERLASYAVHYNPKEAEIPTQICSHGILPMIVSAIQCYPSNHQLVCACLSLLAHAALWPLRAVETLFLDNTIPLLLSMTWNALLENSLASNCMIQLLWAVSLNPTLRDPLIEKHYVIVKKAITALMKVHPWKKDARLLAMGTRVMWVLALDPRVNTQLGNEGYVTQQIEVLKRSLDPTSTQSNRSDVIKAQQVVISNLYTMFTSVENQLKFVEGDGVSVLCEFLLKGVPITPHALSTIYNTLKVLLVHPTVPETLNNAEFIQTAVSHVEQAMENTLTDVLASILSFFWGIVTCTKTCHERITDTVVQILITHTHSQEIIVESCLGVLWAMCYIYPSSSALSPISLLRTHKEKLVKGIVHETMTNLESERVCEVFSQLFQTVESIDETLIDIDVMFTFGLFNLIIQVANIHIRVLNIASSCIRLAFATLQRFPEVELYIQVVPKELCTTLLSLITEKFRQFHPYALTLQFTEHESHVVKTLLQTVVHQLTYSDI